MSRNFNDWLEAFVGYAGFGEAPKSMYKWVGISTIAGALRRKCFIDQYYFRWYPNFYIILVARPGIVSKTTTANIGMDLLKRVPGVTFGPNVVTWQALVQQLAKATEEVETTNGHYETMASMTINSSEFGNLLNPQDREMVDMLVSLWDGSDIRKVTKGSGTDEVPRPLINIIACTTPSWISGNIPEYMLGGGLLSRCIFVFADAKERYVAYPGLAVPPDISKLADRLVNDLEEISQMRGEFAMRSDAIAWGQEWYEKLYKSLPEDPRLGDYVVRKQTHLHKLAMIFSASRRSDMVIEVEDMRDAHTELQKVEARMPDVFSQIGRSGDSNASDEVINLVTKRHKVKIEEVYKTLLPKFPKLSDLDNIIRGALKAGHFTIIEEGQIAYLVAKKKPISGGSATPQ